MNWQSEQLGQAKIAAAEQIPGLNQAQTVRDRSQFEVSAERHSMALNRLSERIAMLRERLQPVLRPSNPPPVSGADGRKPQESLAPIAEAFNQITAQMDGLTFQIEDVLSRLAF